MSADYTLYAVRPAEWPAWQRLSSYDAWVFAGPEDEESIILSDAASGFRSGGQAEFDAHRDMVGRFHREGRACFVSEVSLLKAGLCDEPPDRFVPAAVAQIQAVLARYPNRPVDRGLATALVVALNAPNRSIYRHRRWYWIPRHPVSREGWRYQHVRGWRSTGVTRARHLKRWLAEHHGHLLDASAE